MPVYAAGGMYRDFLGKSLSSIMEQSIRDNDVEVIVSDHDDSVDVFDYLGAWKYQIEKRFRFKYIRNAYGRGNIAINTNVGIGQATGKYIKVLHMDDWLTSEESLSVLADYVRTTKCLWGFLSFDHYTEGNIDRLIVPTEDYFSKIGFCVGNPSTSFFVNDNNFFDANLVMLHDFEMHRYLSAKYGKPAGIIGDAKITIRIHAGQVSKKYDIVSLDIERKYCNNMAPDRQSYSEFILPKVLG